MIKIASTLGTLALGGALGYKVKHAENSWTNISDQPEDYNVWNTNWDRRDPKSLQKPSKHLEDSMDNENSEKPALKSKATRHLILIRHGQYNLDGEEDKDRYLTALGERQAQLTGKRLKELDLPITKVIYSTMTRATQTAKLILEQLPQEQIKSVETSDLLREGSPIPPEPPVGHWRPEKFQFFTDGARIESAFRSVLHRAPPSQTEDSYELVVCHANVIRYFVCRALQFPANGWLRMSLHNGSMTCVSIRPDGRVSLSQLGECGHMPPDALSRT